MSDRAALLAQERDLIALAERRRTNRLADYKPYPKQEAFHALGKTKRERLLRAGNQLGKTWAGGFEMAMHLTGDYPVWWQGHRWERPVRAWVGSKSGQDMREGVQTVLLGPHADESQWGTGTIPKRSLVDVKRARGIADGVDTIVVKHVTGGTSQLTFKTYDQGRERWQAASIDLVWFDEEPDEDIYSEGLTRTNATRGIAYMTFTPLKGQSAVVKRFIKDPTPDRGEVVMTIDDAEHIDAEQRAKIIASYSPHERDARARGVPIMGSGLIYPVARDILAVEPFQVPEWWPVVGGLDFGWTHPTAAVRLAHDRDADTVYVTHVLRMKETPVHTIAASLRGWGDMPFAWPHDGQNSTAGSPDPLAAQYRKHGLAMLPYPASYDDTRRNAVEAGLMDILDRMTEGRFKVFRHHTDWFDEMDQYHRDEGKVVKEYDDLMDATRYAVMSLRFARAKAERHAHERYRRYRSAEQASGWAA